MKVELKCLTTDPRTAFVTAWDDDYELRSGVIHPES